jgi:Flp pilus assembly protein TadB
MQAKEEFMPTEFHTNNPQNLWQSQPTEAFKMSADSLRRKAQRMERKARLAVIWAAAVALALFLWFGWGFLSFPQKFQNFGLGPAGLWTMRLGFGLLSLWGLYSGYKAYKILWPHPAASDADLKTTLQSYRQELEKRRDYSQNIWLRSGLLVCFLGIAMVLTPMVVRDIRQPLQLLLSAGPIVAIFILWLAIFIPQRRRQQRKLQQEIDQLREFEREYRV